MALQDRSVHYLRLVMFSTVSSITKVLTRFLQILPIQTPFTLPTPVPLKIVKYRCLDPQVKHNKRENKEPYFMQESHDKFSKITHGKISGVKLSASLYHYFVTFYLKGFVPLNTTSELKAETAQIVCSGFRGKRCGIKYLVWCILEYVLKWIFLSIIGGFVWIPAFSV